MAEMTVHARPAGGPAGRPGAPASGQVAAGLAGAHQPDMQAGKLRRIARPWRPTAARRRAPRRAARSPSVRTRAWRGFLHVAQGAVQVLAGAQHRRQFASGRHLLPSHRAAPPGRRAAARPAHGPGRRFGPHRHAALALQPRDHLVVGGGFHHPARSRRRGRWRCSGRRHVRSARMLRVTSSIVVSPARAAARPASNMVPSLGDRGPLDAAVIGAEKISRSISGPIGRNSAIAARPR